MDKTKFAYLRDLIEEQIPFNKFLGVKVNKIEKGICSLRIPYREELLGDKTRNTFHGGVISMLITTCGSFAVASMCNTGDKIVTVDTRVDYLKPAFQGSLVAESRIRFVGNRIGSAHTTVFLETDPTSILSEGSSVYNIKRNSKNSN